MEPRHPAEVRAERLIASGRLTLSALTLFAIWLDPVEPSRLPGVAYTLASLYLVYSLILAVVAWTSEPRLVSWRLTTHIFDLIAFAGIIYFTAGSTSPFFAYLVFALIAAALRWQWAGVIATAAAALASYAAIAFPAFHPVADESALVMVVIRSTYLAVFAVLLGHLGAHQMRLRRDLDDLASWPATLTTDAARLAPELLEHVASILHARESALLWRDVRSKQLSLVRSSAAGIEERTAPGDALSKFVAPRLVDHSFVARDGRDAGGEVFYLEGRSVQLWRGAALAPAGGVELPGGPLLSLRLAGRNVEGRVFAFGARRYRNEDLLFGELLSRQIVPQLDQALESARERRAAALDERTRMARDLHDGVIQSLTGANLRLRTVDRLLETEPERARRLLAEIEDLLTTEQQELRWFLAEERESGDWADRLRQLPDRVSRDWGLQTTLDADPDGALTGEFGHEVYRIVQEALVNAARHGHARHATVSIERQGERLHLLVSDDGEGFAFAGELDDAALRAQRLGPVSIKQRVAGLGGQLRIASASSGARLDIELPMPVVVP